MAKVITVINMKGGVGKTTLSVNISYLLAKEHDKKVLLIDIDPQFNATQYLVEQSAILSHFESKKTIYDIIMPVKEEEISLAAVKKKTKEKPVSIGEYTINIKKFSAGGVLDLIPSSLKLINFETSKRGIENLLKKFIDSHCKKYDYVIIDCPPTLSLLTLSAYLASKYYLIPIKPDYLSSLGLPLLERGLQEYEELHNHKLNLLGIVFTMVNTRPEVSKEIMKQIRTSKRSCFKNSSSHSSKVAQSVEKNLTSIDRFYSNSVNKKFADEFKGIVNELLGLIKL